ncbi:bifunctional 2-polyprenyl-6-hydroxyphenol methylase/3-demethylubiquinol 3-O-methyltransferase UbiG [Streptomyces sp. PT12]|uniref:class I SAM-dependent methyltransferase n=1 Tax=Streptomyces sp. PT12 TaxID=1510197 RepID=UPI000DE3DD84|nr:methyltransferase domain-containing protein [Streptomyces sp. PT12]RBM14412.1 hypothetical protein DEH69_18815 [Streptomyces sp. PT12]
MGSRDGRDAHAERVATAYNALNEKGYFADEIGGNEGYLGGLMRHYVPKDAMSILEVGGATGLWMRQVLRARPALRDVTVVELSDAAERCRARLAPLLADRPEGRLTVVQDDFLRAADRLRPAGTVVSSFVADHMGDPAAYLRRLHDLAEPGGRVIAVEVQTSERAPLGTVTPGVVAASFFRLCGVHLRLGKLPPLRGVLRSMPLYKLSDEEAFRKLRSSTDAYAFPRTAWRAARDAYPGAVYHDLGMAGMLVLPKSATA